MVLAVLLCASSAGFVFAEEESAAVLGTPDGWSLQRALELGILVLQPWVLLASSLSGMVLVECAAAVFYSCVFRWLRKLPPLFWTAAAGVIVLSFLLLWHGWRMHAAVIRADQQYQQTYGRQF